MSEHLLDRYHKLPDRGSAPDRSGFHGATEAVGGSVLVRLEGELDMAAAPRLHRVLSVALDAGAPTVALDLTDLTFLDSTGVHVLMSAHRRAADQGCSFVVRSPTRAVLKVLRLTGVDQLMVIEPGPSLN